MEVLGVGLPELAFIVLIALILLGPKDMVAAGRTLGSALRKFIMSPAWYVMRHTGEELQKLPTKLMRDAGLEELQALQEEVQDATRQIQPPDFRKTFNESQIFDQSASTSTAQPASDSQPASPLNEPEGPEGPSATPAA